MKFCAQDKSFKDGNVFSVIVGIHFPWKNNGTLQQGNNSTNSSKGHLKFSLFKTTLYFASIYGVIIIVFHNFLFFS